MAHEEWHGHILVVDDNRINRLKLTRYLEQEGYVVSVAEHGRQALDMLHEARFDAVLLDIMMPVMDGFQVLEAMKKDSRWRDIPVIIISALDEMESVVRGIEMGAEDYLPKPFNATLLRARLSAGLQKKRLRDLERSYLEQTLLLRQSEKLATLGRLSAGMAHELNNPAAAAQRGAEQLRLAVGEVQQAHLTLHQFTLTPAQVSRLASLESEVNSQSANPPDLDPLERGDLEEALESWLDGRGVEQGWEFVPSLVNMGFDPAGLADLQQEFPAAAFASLLSWIHGTYTAGMLLAEIHEGSRRITDIVRALKSYVYLDQAPVLAIDLHEGLDNTLVMLRSKLKRGITVYKNYSPDLPRIEAYGSELNQVWTNIMDNAVNAMGGQGELHISTRPENNRVVVEICDNGPGIPPEIQDKIYDPFFTTKGPGEGTGLGLNITHNIIVQKHQGEISVESRPGRTCFLIKLPLTLSKSEDTNT